MDDRIFSPNNGMDLDYIDELLFEGCWLETTNGSQFLNDIPYSPTSLFDSSFSWPSVESPNLESSLFSTTTPLQDDVPQEDRQRASLFHNLSTSFTRDQNPKSWWIGPEKNPNQGCTVVDRLIRALSCIKESTKNKDSLIQIWVPVNSQGKRFLTTNNQPFSLDLNEPSLANYREISKNYQFPTDESSEEITGLPGRVFKGKVPEWTPDVRFFKRDEYARVGHAQECGVRGTLALPVFEQGSQNCLGVIEVVMTTQKMNYRPEIESVCKALEAVDLTTSDVSGHQNIKISNESYQGALPEILELLKSACETHNLPLAQTWVPCILHGKQGCRHSDENYTKCVSTVDSACYICDQKMQPFHEACSEHHLLKGQGIVGQAFVTNQPCFSSDITSFTKTEYPLSHHAQMFNLHAAVAIRLRSIQPAKSDFVLEFFLPVNCTNVKEQTELLNSLSGIIQKMCRNLRVVMDEELEEEEKGFVVDKVSSKEISNSEQAQDDDSLIEPFTFNATSVSKRGERKRPKSEKTITLDVLRQYFAGSLKDAAKSIGVCPTTLKRICRQHGIKRWPSRKIKKVGHSLEKLQRVIDSVKGASGALQIESFYSNFTELASPNSSKTSPLSISKPVEIQAKLPNVHPSTDSFSSSSSSSSRCFSSGTQPNSNPSPLNISSGDDVITKEHSGNSVLKRVRSETEIIQILGDDIPYILPRSQSHKSLSKHRKQEILVPIPKTEYGDNTKGDVLRIKVMYGEEKIRFRYQKKWKFDDLRKQIGRRFGIDEMNDFQLKYFDDDSEWVLLTCDDDLEECVALCGLAQNDTIKFLLSRLPGRSSSSFGTYSPS